MHSEASLRVEFWKGGQGRGPSEDFCVRLECRLLSHLIDDARRAFRIYELMMIQRPGDVLPYVEVVMERVPARVREGVRPILPEGDVAEPVSTQETIERVPFRQFDQMFYWAWDDTGDEDAAWLRYRESDELRQYLRQLLGIARRAQDQLAFEGALPEHVAQQCRSGAHAYSFLERDDVVLSYRRHTPFDVQLSPAFYKKVKDLLWERDLVSVVMRGQGDYTLYRLLAQEQRRRAARTGHKPGNALYVGALVNHRIDNQDWDSEIWLYSEGLAHGDLYIDDGTGACGGVSLKALVEAHGRVFSNYLLMPRGDGPIRGYELEEQDGWALYRRQSLYDRRVAQDYATQRANRTPQEILRFADLGGTLYGFEVAVFAVGETVSEAARERMAQTLGNWERQGGRLLLIVSGSTEAFERAACRNLVPVTQDFNRDRAMLMRLSMALDRDFRWIDAVFAFEAPAWVCEAVHRRIEDMKNPWCPWIVALGGSGGLEPHLRLAGEAEHIWASAALVSP